MWVTTALQWFPLDQQGKPFKPLGSLQTAYPDLRHYTDALRGVRATLRARAQPGMGPAPGSGDEPR